jgi:hypothetical protein
VISFTASVAKVMNNPSLTPRAALQNLPDFPDHLHRVSGVKNSTIATTAIPFRTGSQFTGTDLGSFVELQASQRWRIADGSLSRHIWLAKMRN